MEIDNIKSATFKSWDSITYETRDFSKDPVHVSKWWGKTFIYYDKDTNKLYAETLSIIERIVRTIFGYKRDFNRTNLWDYLTENGLTAGECPEKSRFRTIVGMALQSYTEKKATFTSTIRNWRATDDAIIQPFKEGLDPKMPLDDFNNSPIFEAASHGRWAVAKHLVEQGADVNATLREGSGLTARVAIHTALFHADEKTTMVLLQGGADLTILDASGSTCLQRAIENLKPKGSGGHKVFHYAGEETEGPKDPKKIIKAILEKNPPLDDIGSGDTALCIAVREQDTEVVGWLLDKGAKINAKGIYGTIPLSVAVCTGNLEMVELLIKRGATVDFVDAELDWNGQQVDSLLSKACNVHSPGIPNLQIITRLIDSGAKVNQQSGYTKRTALHYAAAGGHLELTKYLVSKQADTSIKDFQGCTPEDLAVKHPAIIGYLKSIK